MQVCVDTSVVIDWLRQPDSEKTILYQLIANQYEISISVVAVTELYSGKSVWQHAQAKTRLNGVLAECRVLPLESDAAILAGELRVKHEVALLDALIAATAIQHNQSLATLNTKDFSQISNLSLWSK